MRFRQTQRQELRWGHSVRGTFGEAARRATIIHGILVSRSLQDTSPKVSKSESEVCRRTLRSPQKTLTCTWSLRCTRGVYEKTPTSNKAWINLTVEILNPWNKNFDYKFILFIIIFRFTHEGYCKAR